MRKSFLTVACVALSCASFGAVNAVPGGHVPEQLDAIKPIRAQAANKNHIALVNVGRAINEKDWPMVATYAAARLHVNVWTNAIGKTVFPALAADPSLMARTLGEKAKVAVFIEESDSPYRYLSAPGIWCRVNIRYLKADAPDRQTLLDRMAKAILKGCAYAAASGVALDARSATCYSSLSLKGLDKTGITISPDSYFPMLEVLELIGGDEILQPAGDEPSEE